MMLDVNKIKKDFPVFKNHPDLVYLDSASTSLKPKVMIDKLVEYYEKYPANVKRGIYKMSEKATKEYELTRKIVADLINAKSSAEIIFTRSTTESLNLVCYSLGREIVGRGDEVVTSVMEHHSNFVPWQKLAFENGADFKVIDIKEDGKLIAKMDQVITKKTKILALSYVSNVLGTINPIKEIVRAVKRINPNVVIVIDAAQAVPHMAVDVQDLGVDFLAFSGHKMLGPTGIGVLWGRKKLLEEMFPFNFGGEMIEEVKIESTSWAKLPDKFEAGTPAIAEAIALCASIKYLTQIGLNKIKEHEQELVSHGLNKLRQEFSDDIEIYSSGGVISFNLKGVHPHDVAAILDEEDIAIRAGHHCTMPLHKRLGLIASARASFYLYNDKQDVDKFVNALKKVKKLFKA